MAAVGNHVYGVVGGTLWRLDVNTGSVAAFGSDPNTWGGTKAMTAQGNFVYGIVGGIIWRVNTTTGAVDQLGTASWSGATAMTAIL
jgi:hypothetical protein